MPPRFARGAGGTAGRCRRSQSRRQPQVWVRTGAKGYRALESDRSKLPPLFPSPHSAALIALPAFFGPQRCHMSLELTAEQQSPREGAESRSWNLQWLQLCQGPKRCRQRQQRPGLRGEPCPFAPADPSAVPTPPPAASAEGTFCANSRTWAAGRAPGTYIQAVEAAVHAQSHRTAPRSQAVAAVAAAPLAVTPLAAAPNTPRLLWRDAFLYGPRLSPAPGAAGSGSSPAMPPRSRAPGGRLGPFFVCRPGHGNCTCPARPRGPRSSRGHLPPSD